jgi:hypothetical protein
MTSQYLQPAKRIGIFKHLERKKRQADETDHSSAVGDHGLAGCVGGGARGL